MISYTITIHPTQSLRTAAVPMWRAVGDTQESMDELLKRRARTNRRMSARLRAGAKVAMAVMVTPGWQ